MKQFHYSKIAILAVFVIAASCVIHKDAEIIFDSYVKAGTQANSATFTIQEIMKSGSSPYVEGIKVYAERIKGDDEVGFKYRTETREGGVTTYNGKSFVYVDNNEKTALYSDSLKYAQMLAQRFQSIIQLILQTSKNPFLKIENTKVFRYDGNIDVGGEDCNILYIESPGFDDNSKVKTYLYISENDNFLRKIVRTLYSGNMVIQEEKYLISGLQTDIEIHKELFTQKIPDDYKSERYSPPKQSSEEQLELLAIGTPAPDFTLSSSEGKEFVLSAYLGKVVVLDFWGTWCPWCVVALPKIQTIKDKLPEAEVFGVSCKEQETSDPAKFLKDKGIKYPTLVKGEEVAKKYNVTGYPTIYVIGKDGKILYAEAGYYAEMADSIVKLIELHLKAETQPIAQ